MVDVLNVFEVGAIVFGTACGIPESSMIVDDRDEMVTGDSWEGCVNAIMLEGWNVLGV